MAGVTTHGVVVHPQAGIYATDTVFQEEGILVRKCHDPLAVCLGIETMSGITGIHGIGAGVGIADGDGFGEQFLHAGIRIKGLALDDAEGRNQAAGFRIDKVDRLFLDDLVEPFKVAEVIRRNRIVIYPVMLLNSIFGGLSFFASG